MTTEDKALAIDLSDLARRVTEGAKLCDCPLHTLFPQRISELLVPTDADLKAACDLIGKDTYGKPHWTPETIHPHNPVVQAFARHALLTSGEHNHD